MDQWLWEKATWMAGGIVMHWTYYLLSCAGTFRSRRNQLWQILFSKKGLEGGYEAIR